MGERSRRLSAAIPSTLGQRVSDIGSVGYPFPRRRVRYRTPPSRARGEPGISRTTAMAHLEHGITSPPPWAGRLARYGELTMKRFDIVVFNYERLDSWLRNVGRLQGFDPNLDRITIVSCSPSEKETALVRGFEAARAIRVRYLTRENRGIDQLARVDYFTGGVGTV